MRQSQHNSSNESRNCWSTARERNRIKARFAIRQRVMLHGGSSSSSSADNDDGSAAANKGVNKDASQQIRSILHRIVEGDRSFFSLQYMQEHYALLNEPFPSAFLWEETNDDDECRLHGEQKLLSWFGKDGVKQLERYAASLETCTVTEYAVWLKRYHVTGSLILGGINPGARGMLRTSSENHEGQDSGAQKLLEQVGTMVRQRFFSGVMPLSLSSYIVKRVVDLRRNAWEQRIDRHQSTTECEVCRRTTLSSFLLSFYVDGDRSSCRHHQICEPCLWKDIMKHMEDRVGDVVLCPVCSITAAAGKLETDLGTETTTDESPAAIQRCHESLQKYRNLPVDACKMKKTAGKKKVVHERDVLCSSWSEAVKPSLGLTQSVRRDKLFIFVEKGSYHYVKGCLDSGIDLSLQNEYGQTALFIAVWRGDIRLARLLLQYGSNPHIQANGGLTCLSVAVFDGHLAMIDVLKQSVDDNSTNNGGPSLWNCHADETLLPSPPRVTNLIDWSSDHPGAGSFMLDSFLAGPTIDSLIELWKKLPTEESKTKKLRPCSIRSYYCDAHGWITANLRSALMKIFEDQQRSFPEVAVYPHMRFLCYSESGAALAPHVDLSRIDTLSGQRSTHSFLLYLTDCESGGETALVGAVGGEERSVVLATVKPKRGRLLLFPHRCPHEGLSVEDVPKLLIRGEVWLPLPNTERL